MGFLAWIIFGAIAGWLASIITGHNHSMGTIANIIVGIIGASIGGYLVEPLGLAKVSGFNLYSIGIAVLGAVVLLFIVSLITGRR